ncbi:MAG: ZIP family metal transporter [Actinomycetota bacterium]|nr:ZIP family metal transporter [Actinomycetota bacterium]
MSLSKTMLLGLIAGVTIFLGLPLGRLRRCPAGLRVFLNAASIGILTFLLWDVLSAAWEPIAHALGDVHEHHGGLGRAFGYGALFTAGLAVGLLSLVYYEAWMARRSGSSSRKFGPGAMAADELTVNRQSVTAWSAASRLALLIAVGIGLHNFAEGLAIGQSAARGDLALATLLVIGFGLHNATEGFGIVAPLASESGEDTDLPSWRFLGLMGLIGGGPTFAGAAIGHGFASEAVSVVFLTLAAGSILYVIVQLVTIAAKSNRRDLLAYGLLLGILAGFLTDAIVTAAGV